MNMFTSAKPFIIAGPCGAESEEQLQQIGDVFHEKNIHMIRAGVWKPRSKPGYFEGRGEIALQWLQQLKINTGQKVCTEVANKEQVELALKYEMDAVWIGARSSVNPFVVQEIADALKGNQIGILIKNPINPDIELWSGSIERFLRYNFDDIAAIHRGFSSYDPSSVYRNKPMWSLPIELKRRYPALPIICDISHISGNRDLLFKVGQRALDLDFDGLMIETHPDPEHALSDAQQQITPTRLFELINQLKVRSSGDHTAQQDIEEIRLILDSLDAEIVDIIGKRMEMVKKLGKVKIEHNIPIFQQERWRYIIESRQQWGEKSNLSPDFIFRLFELIHDMSIKTQWADHPDKPTLGSN